MAIKHIKCPQCGGIIEADTEKQFAVCQSCGKALKKKQKPQQPTETISLSDVPAAKSQELTEIDKLFIRAKDMENQKDWQKALSYYNKILDIDPLNETARTQINNINKYTPPQMNNKKSRPIALLLCFFLGSLGVHEFYLNNNKMGVIWLCTTAVGWLTSALIIGGVILVIEAIALLIRFFQIFASTDEMFYYNK